MRTCYLHIGMPKTGTMSIQASLGRATSLGGKFKYIVLDKQVNCSAALLEIFAGEVPQREQELRTGWTPEQGLANRNRLLAQLHSSFDDQHEVFILSGERLHNLTVPQLKELRKALSRHVDQVKVLAYVRGAASWIESAFQQRLKTGSPANFNNLRNVLPKYQAKFLRFDRAFDRENVVLWPFNPAEFPGKDVVLDFCHRLAIPFDASRVIIDNEGVSVDGLALLYLYRRLAKQGKLSPQDKLDVRLLTRQLRDIEGDKMRLSPSVLKPYLELTAADMAWMEERLGSSISALPPERPGALRTEADLLQLTPRALNWLQRTLGDALPDSPTHEQVVAAMDIWLAGLRSKAARAGAAGGQPAAKTARANRLAAARATPKA